MGEQAGLGEDESAHGRQVVHRRRVPVLGEPRPSDGIALLGRFAEREQRLVASGRGPRAGHRQHLLGGEVRQLQPGRRLGEGAVPAAVPAQHRQGDEDLGGEGDPPPVGVVPDGPRSGQEIGQRDLR